MIGRMDLKLTKNLTMLLYLFLLVVTARGFVHANALVDLPLLWAEPWGRIAIYQVYAGLLPVLGWMVVREKLWWRILIWAVAMAVFGQLAALLYVMFAIEGSRGGMARFWFGQRADEMLALLRAEAKPHRKK